MSPASLLRNIGLDVSRDSKCSNIVIPTRGREGTVVSGALGLDGPRTLPMFGVVWCLLKRYMGVGQKAEKDCHITYTEAEKGMGI